MATQTVLILAQDFAAPSEVFVYRRTTYLRRLRPVVACFRRKHPDYFPFEPVHELKLQSQTILAKGVNFLLRRLGLVRWDDAIESGRRFRHMLRTLRPCMILCEGGWVASRLMHHIGSAAVPVAVTFWGSDINGAKDRPEYFLDLSRVFLGADLFIYCCDFLKRRGIELGCPPERSVTVYNGVEVPEEIAWRPSPDGTFRLLCIARMSPVKGLDVLLRAVRLALDAGVPLRLTHVGAGELEGEIRALAGELGLADRVRFLGALPSCEALSHCADSDALVLSSVRCANGQEETSPTVAAEAGAHGLPVIASDIGGVAETVVDGQTGILVPEKDPQALAAAIVRLAGNPAEARALGAAGRERVQERFEVGRQVGAHESALLALVSGGGLSGNGG